MLIVSIVIGRYEQIRFSRCGWERTLSNILKITSFPPLTMHHDDDDNFCTAAPVPVWFRTYDRFNFWAYFRDGTNHSFWWTSSSFIKTNQFIWTDYIYIYIYSTSYCIPCVPFHFVQSFIIIPRYLGWLVIPYNVYVIHITSDIRN